MKKLDLFLIIFMVAALAALTGEANGYTNNISVQIVDLHSFPNPFDNETETATISFKLTTKTSFNSEEAKIYIIIYNLNWKKTWTYKSTITLPTSGTETTCKYGWAGVNDRGKKVSNGIYNCRVIVESADTVESYFKIVVK